MREIPYAMTELGKAQRARQSIVPWPELSSGLPVPLRVQSASLPAWENLCRARGTARVLGRFHRSLDLLVNDTVLAFVLPEIRNGPFHVVLTCFPSQPLPDSMEVRRTHGGIRLGPWLLRTTPPPFLWNPAPPWETLSACAGGLRPLRTLRGLRYLRTLAEQAARRAVARSPFAALLLGEDIPAVTALLQALSHPDPSAVRRAAAQLAGWGPGLTPSGDDFLAGVMLGLWLERGADAAAGCAQIYAAAAPRTTRLSRTFLRAARDGLADERWHVLLRALTLDDAAGLKRAARDVLAFGASSGLDMLAGFQFLTCGSPGKSHLTTENINDHEVL